MPVLVKTMADLLTAIQEGWIVFKWWGTATTAYAIVLPKDVSRDGGILEIWSVTPA